MHGLLRFAFAAVATAGLCVGTAAAAEICFKPRCQLAGPVVRLGDVANMVDTDAATQQRLAALELVPTPPPGTQRLLRASEIADLLRLRGTALTDCRFSGASQVVILAASTQPATTTPPISPNRFAIRRATARVTTAITRHLRGVAPDQEVWQVDVTLDPSHVEQLAAGRAELRVEGGSAPWVGRQVFAVTAGTDGAGPVRVVADVRLPPLSVVAVRSLPAGTRIRQNDVQLARLTSPYPNGKTAAGDLRSIDQVVGRETTRAIQAGQAFNQTLLQQPVLVRRNDVVTVSVRTPGIRVRTNARARDDGSQGDLILVESLTNRRRFFARVTGPGEVDVYAGSLQARLSQ